MKCTITGRIYSDIPKFYSWDDEKQYPTYEEIAKEIWTIEADSLDDAEKWFMINHPEAYMGGSITCENRDFMMLAVPSIEYGTGNYETQEARIKCIRRRLTR